MKNRKTEIFAIFAMFFCIHAFNGLNTPFLPLFLEDMGYGVTARSLLLSIGPIVAMLTQPMWGSFGDRAKDKSNIMRIMALGMVLVTILYILSFLPAVRKLMPGLKPIAVTSMFVLPALILYNFFRSPMQPLSDTITLEYIYQTKPKFKYGPARMTGTIAFMIVSLSVGSLIEVSRHGTGVIFFVQMGVVILMLGVLTFLPKVPGKQEKKDKEPAAVLFKDPWFVMILIMAFVCATTMGFYASHFSTYLRDQLHAGERIVGMSSAISSVLEIILFFTSYRIIRKTGILNLMLIDLCLVATRWMIFSVTTSIPVIMGVQFFTQPFSWAILSYTLSVFIQRAIEDKMHSRAQGLLNGTALSFGSVLGTLGGGFAIRAVGEHMQRFVFLGISILCIGTIVAAVTVFTKLGWRPNRTPERFQLHDTDAA
ncbi:MAG: MFS transporter [Clostridia bacterium]|nr:MFS transporter [Clostridia bacterium]